MQVRRLPFKCPIRGTLFSFLHSTCLLPLLLLGNEVLFLHHIKGALCRFSFDELPGGPVRALLYGCPVVERVLIVLHSEELCLSIIIWEGGQRIESGCAYIGQLLENFFIGHKIGLLFTGARNVNLETAGCGPL